MVQQAPPRDPISEGWMSRGAPVDYISRDTASCPRCQTDTVQDSYRTIMGRWGGFGSPWFVKLFLKRSSTVGKVGKRSMWRVCSQCGSMLPADAEARDAAGSAGSPDGFIH